MHDELCARPTAFNCDCELINIVRENERERISSTIEKFASIFGNVSSPMLHALSKMARNGETSFTV